MRSVRLGIIGMGYWGPNYFRVFNELDESEILYCCDFDTNALDFIKKAAPDVKLTKDYNEVVSDNAVDALIIATPPDTHYQIARDAMLRGKHVFVEKPLTCNCKEAQKLIDIAKNKNLKLMVGHVYVYNSAIAELQSIIKKGGLGELYYISAERKGLGPIRKKGSALWDLAIHDVSVAMYLLDAVPVSVLASGGAYLQDKIEDVIFLSLEFPCGVIYHIHATWFAPEKIRTTTLIGSKAMAVFNDTNPMEMLKIYNRKVNKKLLNTTPEHKDHQAIIAIGDVYMPDIQKSEPLKAQSKHFLDCIRLDKKPLTDGYNGMSAVCVLEAAERSLKTGKKEPLYADKKYKIKIGKRK